MTDQQTFSADRYSSGVLSHELPTELQRLRLLEQMLDPVTTAALAARPLPEDARCLELGAGAGSVTRWLAERFPSGQVTAVDVDARFLDASWASNLEIREADVRSLEFPEASFDLIHSRTLFMHLPEREALVARAAQWLRPGGWIVIEDVGVFPADSSPHPAWRTVMSALTAVIESQGTDLSWARRRQPAVLAESGLSDVGLSLEVFTVGDGGPAEAFWRAFLNQLRPALVGRGHLTEAELDAVFALFDTPGFIDFGEALITAWGRRP